MSIFQTKRDTMVEYRVYFENKDGVIRLTRMFNNEKDTSTVTEDILQLGEMGNHVDWREPKRIK
jgi:hypothetical protein